MPSRAAATAGRGDRRVAALSLVVVVQAICAVFFIADVWQDFHWEGPTVHNGFEAAVAFALAVGTVFGGFEIRRAIEQVRRADAAHSAASGAFAELVETRFDGWQLTPAEADVALLALKGFDVAEIAGFRNSADGTVRAQLTRIYAKAGVASRAQLVSLFVDELFAGPVVTGSGADNGDADR